MLNPPQYSVLFIRWRAARVLCIKSGEQSPQWMIMCMQENDNSTVLVVFWCTCQCVPAWVSHSWETMHIAQIQLFLSSDLPWAWSISKTCVTLSCATTSSSRRWASAKNAYHGMHNVEVARWERHAQRNSICTEKLSSFYLEGRLSLHCDARVLLEYWTITKWKKPSGRLTLTYRVSKTCNRDSAAVPLEYLVMKGCAWIWWKTFKLAVFSLHPFGSTLKNIWGASCKWITAWVNLKWAWIWIQKKQADTSPTCRSLRKWWKIKNLG